MNEPQHDEQDDWAPLPSGASQAHPGEDVHVRAKQTIAPGMEPGAAAPERAVRDVAADLALRALHDRLTRQRPSQSLVAQVMRREQESVRRAAAAAVPATATPAATPPSAPEFTESGAAEHQTMVADEAWFRGLPAAEQERLRQVWASKEQRLLLDVPWRRREKNRRSQLALFVFATVAVLGGSTWWLVMCAGVLTAIWWRYRSADRIGDPVTATICFFAVSAFAAAVHGGVSPSLVFDAILVTALAAMIGMEGEMRSTGGFVATPRPDEVVAPPRPPSLR